MSATFRPSLTLAEITFLLSHVRWDDANQPALLRKLEVFTLKAKHGITKASHLRVGKQSDAAKLGFEDDKTMGTLLEFYNNPESRELLSPAQLQRVQYHRYMEDMMTPEEEKAYEAAL